MCIFFISTLSKFYREKNHASASRIDTGLQGGAKEDMPKKAIPAL